MKKEDPGSGEGERIKIAQVSCGTVYGNVQGEIEKAAKEVGAEIFVPEVDLDYVAEKVDEFGYDFKNSLGLSVALARGYAVAEELCEADAVFVAGCHKCPRGAVVRTEIRKIIQERTSLPLVMYPFSERTKAGELLTRMEALVTIVKRRWVLERKVQEGLTAGIDSGSTTTKAAIMQENEVLGVAWSPTREVVKTGEKVFAEALELAGVKRDEIEALGTTGYGRHALGEHFKADLVQEELTVNSKAAMFLAGIEKGEAMIIDIGGMDNKIITANDGIPDNFTMGGICAGASGRFLEMIARRLGVGVVEMGKLALEGDYERVKTDSYCIVFGIQDLVSALSSGARREDVAAAACHSVVEQVKEQLLQEIDLRQPAIEVGGTALVEGVPAAMNDVLGFEVVVPKYPQYIGAVGGALLSSSFRRK
ncbi:methanogenesis marker 15 protein [ANME-1 cluster archaeon ex4572_4]|nr:methanogenesis marker 15 protein [Methanophagales archaeon]OYT67142.1 MAG: methanogenesis marker 15 protein [ANME-1 cluster archaeon ex4572_4]PXF51344.1 MAG: methanogenesis marker 15 protein [Methanophagales archaeon]HDN68001.1 methanogenesis marker 15 protein [Methanomicrobia archaeon]